ncbi:hypothetical protein OPV22_006753 [Ensete ventricosum]|uniref:Cyclin n=1 Tax=Ensete ventricosum TaxID=4639 RepID=A0AAV8QCG3_ENSVE|nr:hypothetical protein OPV22_006753 [Ensete ventricosum]
MKRFLQRNPDTPLVSVRVVPHRATLRRWRPSRIAEPTVAGDPPRSRGLRSRSGLGSSPALFVSEPMRINGISAVRFGGDRTQLPDQKLSLLTKVLTLLSSILEAIVQKNEKKLDSLEIKEFVTLFDGLRAPTLSIKRYMERIFKYSKCSPSCFVLAYIYIERFLQQPNIRLTSLNVHRLLIASVVVAAKFIDDAFFSNAYYAKVGGISTLEMNRLEINFLFSVDFRLQVTVVATWLVASKKSLSKASLLTSQEGDSMM